MSQTPDLKPPVGVTRPRVDYAAMERVYLDVCEGDAIPQAVMVDGEMYVAGEQMPEHVLQTLRDWVNFE